jgi:alkylresorcinol/alkylpyrone synthase
MPRLRAISTAVPPYKVGQDQVRDFAERVFQDRIRDIRRLLPIFENSGVQTRYFSVPPEWFDKDHSLEEKNEIYIRTATELGASAARSLFDRTGITPADIDCIFYVNTTGLATPSIDARLINVLGLRHDIRRTPIWGLGCAGGAAGLTHAFDYLRGHPTHRVLLVAVELCGLTFIHGDTSKSNLVACSLFGDGAAAALLSGDEVPAEGPEILAVQSTFYPDSLDIMGWNIISRGMQVVFNKRIPDIVADKAGPELQTFLDDCGLTKNDISHYLYHPGGTKVLNAYEAAYGVAEAAFDLSRGILNDFGNMSSVTVLFVVERYLDRVAPSSPEYTVVSALGPGFCSESLLMKR